MGHSVRSPPIELLSKGNSLRLPLGLEAPVMMPNDVIFLFFSFNAVQSYGRPWEHKTTGNAGAAWKKHDSFMQTEKLDTKGDQWVGMLG